MRRGGLWKDSSVFYVDFLSGKENAYDCENAIFKKKKKCFQREVLRPENIVGDTLWFLCQRVRSSP